VGVGQELREVLTTWKKETRYHRALALGLNNLTSATLVRPQWWLESGRMDKAPGERVRPNEASASFWFVLSLLCGDMRERGFFFFGSNNT